MTCPCGPWFAVESLPIKRRGIFESFEDLGRLCHVLPDCSVVVMMDSSGDDRIQLNSSFLSVMRLGVSQIVGLPLNPQDFTTALKRIAEKSATIKNRPRTRR
jgi:hypothetical protein